jgi:hypothetical protein
VQETPWVRSVYLYLMCVVSIVLVGIGAIGFVTGAVHTVAPDLGHRDTLDRIGIGVSNIATTVLDVVNETAQQAAEESCRDFTDTESDFQDCMGDEGLSQDSMGAIEDGISEVRSELRSQIRNNSVDTMIRGLLLIGAGVLLFRIHGRRTELFANGLIPKPAIAAPTAAPAPSAPIPPPPAAGPPGSPPPA